MPGIGWAKKKELGKQQRSMSGGGNGDWNEGYVEKEEEGRDRWDEIQVGEDRKTVCFGSAEVARTLPVSCLVVNRAGSSTRH